MRGTRVVVALVVVLAGLSPSPAPAAEIGPLLERAGAAARAQNHGAAIEALEAAIETLRQEAPLVVKPFHLVSRAAKFYGDYVPREPTLRRGEAKNIGKLEDLMVDSNGHVRYAVLSFGGFLGFGDKY